ncbi:DUF5707 domain-containing protein [Streptomyces sp. NPDC087294]|uniref:DUF5707 domain-containing protein n=1 Tax=Streptomyces sp. NPDC087294 TaxID=3365777 RepID=UPI0037FF56E7
MSKRVLVSSLVGVAVVGGVVVGGLSSAFAATELTVDNAVARFSPASGGEPAAFTFTADVRDDSGVKSLNVVAWPAASKLDPTEKDMRSVEKAICVRVSDEKSTCTYRPALSEKDANELAEGTWYVSALATAEDGDTAFVPKAATFEVTR